VCKNIKLILSLALFVLFSGASLYSQSSKDQLIEQLTQCQGKLQTASQSIESYKINITNLKSQIANLSQQLADSKNDLSNLNQQLEASWLDLEALNRQLETCRQLLTDSQADLKKQEQIYATLSKDLGKLKTELALYRNSMWILAAVSIGLGGYVSGHIAGLW
jgi:chromosome segregation ATPase